MLLHRFFYPSSTCYAIQKDTNGLALHTLAPVLGVSTSLELEVNSMAIPRKAKQAVGGIATLTRDDGSQMTVSKMVMIGMYAVTLE